MSRNKSISHLMVYVLFGLVAVAAVIPWGRPALSSYEFEVVDQHLQQPIAAEAGEAIAVVFKSTIRPPRDFKPYEPKGRVDLFAFKVPETALRTPLLNGSKRIYQTSLLDKKFVNKLLHRAPVAEYITFEQELEAEAGFPGDVHHVTLFNMLMPPGYDPASYDVESLREKCAGQLVRDTSGLTIARQASDCIGKFSSLEGFALQSPSGFFTDITCFGDRQKLTHCDMDTVYRSRLISIVFDGKRVNDWREVQSAVIGWLDNKLVFEMKAVLE